MSKNALKKIVRSYAAALRDQHVPFRHMYLFGSQATGQATRWSDIDVLVVADRFPRGYFQYKKNLWRATVLVDGPIEPHACTVQDFKRSETMVAAETKRSGIKIM